MSAPIFTSMRARSWTWGSQAALPITVVPGVSAAAISAFSVAITDGSSMNTSVGRRPRGALSTISPSQSVIAPIARKASRWGSRRRRPMTSPPGGGMTARPKRASSGPASRNEALIDSASSGSIATSCTPAAHSTSSLGPRQVDLHADRDEDLEHRLHVADARDVANDDLVLGEDAGGEDRQRAVLVPGRHHRARQRDAAFDDELLHELWAPPAGRRGSAASPVGRLASVTAICSDGVRALPPVHLHRSPAGRPRRRAPTQRPNCNVPLQPRSCRGSQSLEPNRDPTHGTTYTRSHASVRRRSYLTNTCSPQRQTPSLRSARSVLYAWPARSCCSRTTTSVDWEVGQDERTRVPHPHRRRCAEGAPSVAPASAGTTAGVSSPVEREPRRARGS